MTKKSQNGSPVNRLDWKRVSKYGMQSGEYRVAKVYLDGCSLYELFYQQELIATCNDFDECKLKAEEYEIRRD